MNLELISKHRNSIFGISIIGIMLFHYCEGYMNAAASGIITNNIVVFLYYYLIGSTGVEIFLFLSGMGLFYSFSKNHHLKSFYFKRFSRILICYIPMGIVFWILEDFVLSGTGAISFLKDFTFISFFINGESYVWFIAFILVLYAVFPVIYHILYRKGTANTLAFLGLIAVVIALTGFLCIFAPDWYAGTEIALTRIPVFCLGCFAGESIANKKKIRKGIVFLIIVVGIGARGFALVTDFPSIFSRYAATLWSIPLLLFCCWFMNKLEGTFIDRGLKTVGTYSLELYLSHVMVRALMSTAGLPTYRPGCYLLLILISVIVSIGVHKLAAIINRKLLAKENHDS